jgi:hypothetical protein
VDLTAGFLVPGSVAEPSLIVDTNGVYMAMIGALGDSDSQDIFLGISATAAVITTQAYVGVESDGSDGEFQLVVDDGSSNAIQEFTLYPEEGAWFLLEVAIDSGGVIGRLTTEDGQETQVATYDELGVDANGDVGFPVVASAGAGDVLSIDALHVRYGRPEEAAASGISWLG